MSNNWYTENYLIDAQVLLAHLKNTGAPEAFLEPTVALNGNIRDGWLSEVTGHLSGLIGRPTTPLKQGLEEGLATI